MSLKVFLSTKPAVLPKNTFRSESRTFCFINMSSRDLSRIASYARDTAILGRNKRVRKYTCRTWKSQYQGCGKPPGMMCMHIKEKIFQLDSVRGKVTEEKLRRATV